jgi:hypothetical protein
MEITPPVMGLQSHRALFQNAADRGEEDNGQPTSETFVPSAPLYWFLVLRENLILNFSETSSDALGRTDAHRPDFIGINCRP